MHFEALLAIQEACAEIPSSPSPLWAGGRGAQQVWQHLLLDVAGFGQSRALQLALSRNVLPTMHSKLFQEVAAQMSHQQP